MGSEMCIRDRGIAAAHEALDGIDRVLGVDGGLPAGLHAHDDLACLLYTSDAADDLLCVDLGGRRNIKKKKTRTQTNKRKM